jgi:hypothetical protein
LWDIRENVCDHLDGDGLFEWQTELFDVITKKTVSELFHIALEFYL